METVARPLCGPRRLPVQQALVLDLPFDERSGNRVYDRSGKGNHGTIYGMGSLYLDGLDDDLTIPDHADFALGTNDFTFDFELWLDALPGLGGTMKIFYQETDDNNKYYIDLYRYPAGTPTTIRYEQKVGGSWTAYFERTITPPTAGFSHFALTRNGNDWRFFQGGSQLSSVYVSAEAIPDVTGYVYLGSNKHIASFLNARLKEFRLSNIARWTSSFTPPTGQYTPDANTKLLLHLSDGTGTTARDSSGNTHHGTLNGCTWDLREPWGTPRPFAAGPRGPVWHADGEDDYVDIVGTNIPQFGNDPFSIVIMLKTSTISDIRQIFRHRALVGTGYFAFYAYTYWFQLITRSSDTNELFDTIDWSPIVANTWYHVIITRSQTTWKLYVNGNLVDTSVDSRTGKAESFNGWQIAKSLYAPYYGSILVRRFQIYTRELNAIEARRLAEAELRAVGGLKA